MKVVLKINYKYKQQQQQRQKNIFFNKMLVFASLIGGWDKLELWGHTHLELLGLLVLVCIAEVILFKLAILAGLFPRSYDHQNITPSYNDTPEYDEIIYYEPDLLLTTNQGEWPQSETVYHQTQSAEEQQMLHHYNNPDISYNNQIFNNQLSNSTGIFRYVY